MSENDREFRFGPYRLSKHRRELATDRGPVPLGARAFDLLAVLVEGQGELLSKQELLDLVWAGVLVEESNLHVQMSALRRALGAHQGLIQNVPGRGYRFTGDLISGGAQPDQAVASLSAVPKPLQLDRPGKTLIGRETELAELLTALHHTRLLTLVGPGGVGKTHLAVTAMQALASAFPGAAYPVDLAPLKDAALVESAVLAALGLRPGEGAEADAAQRIADALKDRPALLLFDNCEHVLHAMALLTDALLSRSGSITILVTSQEPLRIAGETIFRLDPLAVPPVDAHDAQTLEQFGAVALFVQRAIAGDRRFGLTAENGAVVAEICRSLDGIPLALEMAAARLPMLGLNGLRDRLQERFRVLTQGARTAPLRHQTLRSVVSWSYDLLDATDRAIFRGLGIFAGGFSAQAAVSVVMPDPADEWTVIDALSRLIDKSMVVAGPGNMPRYRLLDTLRLFAIEEMAAHGEADALAARHAAYFDTLFEDAYQDWETTDDKLWLAKMSPELDNLRAALDWLSAAPDAGASLVSIAGSSALVWEKLSLLAEGRRYLGRAEAALGPATPAAVAARLYRHIAALWYLSDRDRTYAALERSEALYRSLDDTAALGALLASLGFIRSLKGDADGAADNLQEASRLLRGTGRLKSQFVAFNNLGASAVVDGDMHAARAFFEEALTIAQSYGFRDRAAFALMNLAEVAFCLGEVGAASEYGLNAANGLRALGEKLDLGLALVNLTNYLLILDQPENARMTWREALSLLRDIGGFMLRVCLQQCALLAAIADNQPEAARLQGFVELGFDTAGETLEHAELEIHDRLQARLDGHFPKSTRLRLQAEGAAWTEGDAVKRAEALEL